MGTTEGAPIAERIAALLVQTIGAVGKEREVMEKVKANGVTTRETKVATKVNGTIVIKVMAREVGAIAIRVLAKVGQLGIRDKTQGIWIWKTKRLAEPSVEVVVATPTTMTAQKERRSLSAEKHLLAVLGSMTSSTSARRSLRRWRRARKLRKKKPNSTIRLSLPPKKKKKTRRKTSRGNLQKMRLQRRDGLALGVVVAMTATTNRIDQGTRTDRLYAALPEPLICPSS